MTTNKIALRAAYELSPGNLFRVCGVWTQIARVQDRPKAVIVTDTSGISWTIPTQEIVEVAC